MAGLKPGQARRETASSESASASDDENSDAVSLQRPPIQPVDPFLGNVEFASILERAEGIRIAVGVVLEIHMDHLVLGLYDGDSPVLRDQLSAVGISRGRLLRVLNEHADLPIPKDYSVHSLEALPEFSKHAERAIKAAEAHAGSIRGITAALLRTAILGVTDCHTVEALTKDYADMAGRATGGLLGAANDLAATQDRLGFIDYVRAFADLIESPNTDPPITIGIFGSWGMGKSFLLQQLIAELRERGARTGADSAELGSADRRTVHVVYFNAWEYSASEVVWPGLVRKIMDTLENEAKWGFVRKRITRFRRNLARLVKAERVRLFLVVTVLITVTLVGAVRVGQEWDWIAKLALALGIGGIVSLFKEISAHPISQWIVTLFQEHDYGKQIGYMEEIRSDLDFLVSQIAERGNRVLVIIDDLDRCEPDKAVEVLKAIKLLLDFPAFIVCLGIDARVVSRAIEHHYKDILGPAGASGYEYLEKIVQIPFHIPEPSDDELRTFVRQQLGDPQEPVELVAQSPSESVTSIGEEPVVRMASSTRDDEPETDLEWPVSLRAPFTSREAAAFERLAPFMRPNPRHVKRLINVYRLVRNLARRKGQSDVLAHPEAVLRWLLISAQWPSTAASILSHYDRLAESGSLPENVNEDPLHCLYERLKPSLDPSARQRFDSDSADLERLLQIPDGRITWEQFRAIRRYTVHFNPSVGVDENVAMGAPLRATPQTQDPHS